MDYKSITLYYNICKIGSDILTLGLRVDCFKITLKQAIYCICYNTMYVKLEQMFFLFQARVTISNCCSNKWWTKDQNPLSHLDIRKLLGITNTEESSRRHKILHFWRNSEPCVDFKSKSRGKKLQEICRFADFSIVIFCCSV